MRCPIGNGIELLFVLSNRDNRQREIDYDSDSSVCRLQAALGYLPEEVLGQSIYNFVHNDDLERLSKFHKNCESIDYFNESIY